MSKWKQNQEKKSCNDGKQLRRFHDVRRFENGSQIQHVFS